MVLPELIFALFLLSVAIILIGVAFNKRSSGVELHDEWIETKAFIGRTDRKKYLIIGFLGSFIAVYLISGNLVFGVLAIPAGFIIANNLAKKKEMKRKALLEEQYTQVLNTIITSLEGRANPYQALEESVAALKNPAKEVFIEILRRSRTGTNYHEAIGSIAEEVDWEDLRQLEMAFKLYDSTGSNLVEVCKYLLKNAYDRRSNKKYVASVTAQTKVTAITLSVIPFGLMVIMRLIAPEFIYPLFHTTGGIIVALIVVGMVYSGNLLVNKMVSKIG
ncbi:flp pilus assembly protein tadb [hydrocarbon metagenome]|uniref:Flp pilus assembly protein tadb n=1 Tax=hydrocarbon metagenome TaxID=938273 RepID=A0A0W8E9V4_9ZZZZ